MRRLLGLSLFVLTVTAGHYTTGAMAQSGKAAGDSSGNALAGQAIFYDHACYSCHGHTGETGARVLVGSGFLLSEVVFRTYLRLRAEQNPILPSTQMPNYAEESLSDEQVADLYAYIQTLEGDTPALEDIPALNAILEAAGQNNEL